MRLKKKMMDGVGRLNWHVTGVVTGDVNGDVALWWMTMMSHDG
jgi:hypothetical protein